MLTCREVLEFLMDYLEASLSSAQRAIFEEHLATCTACVAYLHTYQRAVKLGKSIPADDHDASVPEDLVQAILAARKG